MQCNTNLECYVKEDKLFLNKIHKLMEEGFELDDLDWNELIKIMPNNLIEKFWSKLDKKEIAEKLGSDDVELFIKHFNELKDYLDRVNCGLAGNTEFLNFLAKKGLVSDFIKQRLDSWSGCYSFYEAVNFVNKGWIEPIDLVKYGKCSSFTGLVNLFSKFDKYQFLDYVANSEDDKISYDMILACLALEPAFYEVIFEKAKNNYEKYYEFLKPLDVLKIKFNLLDAIEAYKNRKIIKNRIKKFKKDKNL